MNKDRSWTLGLHFGFLTWKDFGWQIRLGPLWITRITSKGELTVWWSHWLKVFHGEFMTTKGALPR